MDLIYSILGFTVGLLVGMTGVGGGSIMTPALIYGLNVPAAIAVGTDLLFAAFTKSVAVLIHSWQKTVDWKIVARLGAGSVPGAVLTLSYLSHLQAQKQDVGDIINFVLGVALVLTAIVLIIPARKPATDHQAERRAITPLTVGAGFVLGVLVTISSVGAGALGVTVLTLLYPRLSTVRLVGTDLAHAVPLTLIGGLGHLALGNVDFGLLAALLLGSIPGTYLGGRLGLKLSQNTSRRVLGGLLAIVGFKFIF